MPHYADLQWVSYSGQNSNMLWLLSYVIMVVAIGDAGTHLTALTVQSSYRTNIPEHLIVCAANIQLMDTIGQGIKLVGTIDIYLSISYTSGEFGIVYKGLIVKNLVTDVVAIKTLKGNKLTDHIV